MTQFRNNHGGIQIQNLITIGATNMINADGKLITAKDNLAVNAHPFWSDIVSYSPGGTPLLVPQPEELEDAVLGDLVDRISSELAEDCYMFKEAVFLDQPVAKCSPGYYYMGYDRDSQGGPGVSRHLTPKACTGLSSNLYSCDDDRTWWANRFAARPIPARPPASGEVEV